jgi:hypothetical protein
MPSERQVFAFFCSAPDHRPQNSGCSHTAQRFHTAWVISRLTGPAFWLTVCPQRPNNGHVSRGKKAGRLPQVAWAPRHRSRSTPSTRRHKAWNGRQPSRAWQLSLRWHDTQCRLSANALAHRHQHIVLTRHLCGAVASRARRHGRGGKWAHGLGIPRPPIMSAAGGSRH